MRNLARLSSWSVALCLVLVVAAVVASLLIDDGLKRHGPFWDKYQKVQVGMRASEVKAILGPPAPRKVSGGGLHLFGSVWQEGGREIEVEWALPFSGYPPIGEGVVSEKRFRPKPLLERMLDWFRGS
jgi:hypothetical protein